MRATRLHMGDVLPSSVTSTETHSAPTIPNSCLWHLVAADQLASPLQILRVQKCVNYLMKILLAVISFITFFLCPKFIFKETNSTLKFEIFQPAPFLKHHQYQNSILPLFQVLQVFLPTAPNICPVLKNEHFKRVWTRIWTFIIILVNHIEVIGSLWTHKLT